MSAAAQARALLSAVPSPVPPAALAVRRAGAPLPGLLAGGRVLSREETAAALFEAQTDCFGLPSISTATLHGIVRGLVTSMDHGEFAELTGIFATLDSVEFPEVGECRWYAYRLHLAAWYPHARTRPVTIGEAAAALCLSDWGQHAGAPASGPRALALHIRQGAARVPATVLRTLGVALTGEFAHAGHQAPGWLAARLLPDYRRRRACFEAIRTRAYVPTPVMVRPDNGGYALGATPPPGPGNHWARPLREGW